MLLPPELIDLVLSFTENFYLIKYFKQYMSRSTVSKLIKDKDIYSVVKNGDILGLDVLLELEYHDPDKLLRCAVMSRKLEVFKKCYSVYRDIFNEKNIIFSAVKRDLVDILKFLYKEGQLEKISRLYDHAIRWHAEKIIDFLTDTFYTFPVVSARRYSVKREPVLFYKKIPFWC